MKPTILLLGGSTVLFQNEKGEKFFMSIEDVEKQGYKIPENTFIELDTKR